MAFYGNCCLCVRSSGDVPDSAIDPWEDHRWSDSRTGAGILHGFILFWNVGSDRSDRIPAGGISDCIWPEDHPRVKKQSDGQIYPSDGRRVK